MSMLHGGEIYDKKIELDFSVNLNPMGCPEEVLDAALLAARETANYPDITQTEFRKAVAKAEGIQGDNIVGGNGASELLMAIVNMIRPKKALLPVPSFYGYEHVLHSVPGCEIEHYILSESFELAESFADAINESTDIVILGNPNNPTGRVISKNVLIRIMDRCKETGTALIVDECFIKLSNGGISARNYINDYPDLYVVDAYTKLFSIPGVRVGFAITCAENAKELWRYLPEWNMSVFANRAGIMCAELTGEGSFTKKSQEMIAREREYLVKELSALGIRTYPSDTNFILIQSDRKLYNILINKGILIRDCRNFAGLDEGFYRIVVRDHESNLRLISEI